MVAYSSDYLNSQRRKAHDNLLRKVLRSLSHKRPHSAIHKAYLKATKFWETVLGNWTGKNKWWWVKEGWTQETPLTRTGKPLTVPTCWTERPGAARPEGRTGEGRGRRPEFEGTGQGRVPPWKLGCRLPRLAQDCRSGTFPRLTKVFCSQVANQTPFHFVPPCFQAFCYNSALDFGCFINKHSLILL